MILYSKQQVLLANYVLLFNCLLFKGFFIESVKNYKFFYKSQAKERVNLAKIYDFIF